MKKHIYKVGSSVAVKDFLHYESVVIPPGTYIVASILKDGSNNTTHYGIVTKNQKIIQGWGDLSGMCTPGCGLWIPIKFLYKYFAQPEFGTEVFIREEFVFKKQNLKGKKCRLIGGLPRSNTVFVELGEFVDGCSADGLGKAGHCILIPRKYLKKQG